MDRGDKQGFGPSMTTTSGNSCACGSRIARGLLLTSHLEATGRRWTTVTPAPSADTWVAPATAAHDMFGDGGVLLVPTSGHTPGSLSPLARHKGMPPILSVGDLCCSTALLDVDAEPGVGSRRALRESSHWVRLLRRRLPDLLVLSSHDPLAAARLSCVLEASQPSLETA